MVKLARSNQSAPLRPREKVVTDNGLTGRVKVVGTDDLGPFVSVTLDKDDQTYKYDPWEVKHINTGEAS